MNPRRKPRKVGLSHGLAAVGAQANDVHHRPNENTPWITLEYYGSETDFPVVIRPLKYVSGEEFATLFDEAEVADCPMIAESSPASGHTYHRSGAGFTAPYEGLIVLTLFYATTSESQ